MAKSAICPQHNVLLHSKINCMHVFPWVAGVLCRDWTRWSAHTLQLQSFISGMGRAIRNITELSIHAQSGCALDLHEPTLRLYLLAPAVQLLQKLIVPSDVGRDLLASLASSCGNLHHLVITELTHASASTLQQLQLILPAVNHLQVISSTGSAFAMAGPCLLSLISNTSLVHLDICPWSLRDNMWNLLPHGLQELRCSLLQKPPAGLQPLHNLQQLDVQCHFLNHVNLCSVVNHTARSCTPLLLE